MRLVVNIGPHPQPVELAQASGTATLADLIREASGEHLPDDAGVWLDDRRYPIQTPVVDAPLLDGTTIGLRPTPVPERHHDWVAIVSGGLASGQVARIPTSRPLVIGRADTADLRIDSPSASWLHATVARDGDGLRVVDTGSSNGVLIDGVRVPTETPAAEPDTKVAPGAKPPTTKIDAAPEPPPAPGVHVDHDCVLTVGGATVRLQRGLDEVAAPRPGSLPNATPAGTVPFNRPPRPGAPKPAEPISLPEKKTISPASRFSYITVFLPLVGAIVMVAVMRNFSYALFAALSPVLAIGTWFDQKQRHKREVRDEDTRFATAIADLTREIDAADQRERSRRQEAAPVPALTLRWAALPTTRLWERRADAPDFLTLHAGIGACPWQPPLDSSGHRKREEAVKQVLDDHVLTSSPIAVELGDAGVVGIVGDREASLALARSLVAQAACQCGPADLTLAVFSDQGRDAEWEWTAWLPHTRRLGDGSGDRWLSAERTRSEAFLRTLRDGVDQLGTPALLLVLDSDVLTEGREAPARDLLGHGRRVDGHTPREQPTRVAGIVLAAQEQFLPAKCTTIIEIGPDADAVVKHPRERLTIADVVAAGITLERAERCALDLAHFEDPDLTVPGAALPGLVKLPTLLDPGSLTAAGIVEAWRTSRGYNTPVGVGENGVFSLDLVADGPHGLVGGTTGSGKSEFLRTLVAGLAARNDPTKLTFILVDFKGGAAFAQCEALPHTIGTISNLDEQLADRAIRALEAEMKYRQRKFAEAGEAVDNLDAYLATNPAEPMPRLLFVVDEFAMLAKEHPDVLSALVSVAAVGRTLGVHMILATQRPAGVVNDDILANTNLRVALRVQSREDSVNVVEVPHAASIGRDQRGRAFVKLGQDDITPVQTALISGPLETEEQVPLDIRPLVAGRPASSARPKQATSKTTELDVLIDAIVAANAQLGLPAPRPVWPEALGERVQLAGFAGAAPDTPLPCVGGMSGERIVIGLSDDPDHQRQVPAAWNLADGNLLLLGIPGSGTTTALATIALSAARSLPPEELDLLILDVGSRDLAPLEKLPHTAAYVGAGIGAREQQDRFITHLRTEIERRRATPGPHRRTLVLVDGFATLRDENQEFEGQALLDSFYRAYNDGPDLGIWFAVTSTRAKSVPSAIEEVTTQRWLFRLADPYDYSSAGIRGKDIPAAVPGRCVPTLGRMQTHIATPGLPLADAVALVADGRPGKGNVVGRLPEHVYAGDVASVGGIGDEPWRFPVGIRDRDLAPAVAELYEAEHFLVAGPVRSGKSSLLLGVAQCLRAAAGRDGVELAMWAICGRRSPLLHADFDQVVSSEDEVPGLLAQARMMDTPLALFIDDAHTFADGDQAIANLLKEKPPTLHVFAAGRSDDLRSLYGHWTQMVRKSTTGVLIQPNVDYDGDLLGARVPRRAPVAMITGRGYFCSGGVATLVHALQPDSAR